MIANLKPYPANKDSSVNWLGDVPAHWEVRRLRDIADVRFSNVDKHSKHHETAVRLCNYSDVYHNDRIRSNMEFMRATATDDEIDKFELATGDVLITKDSETWNDIGVPALVESTVPSLVCGYHLALVRPKAAATSGEFLSAALSSPDIATQLHVCANGVTRFGLSQNAIKSTRLPVPPLPEQTAIAGFLDYAIDQIDRYILVKEKLIALLEEQKQALVHDAVTGRIDVRTGKPYPAYKATGVEWLGKVPSNWKTLRTKYVLNEVDDRSATGEETPMSMSQVLGLVPSNLVDRTLAAASHVGAKLCNKDDLVLNRLKAHLGVFALARQTGVVSPDYTVFRAQGAAIMPYLELALRLPALRTELRTRSKGIVEGFWRLYTDDFFNIVVPIPPTREQTRIVEAVSQAGEQMDALMERTRATVTLLKEFRTRLIADVVTGKLDVRDSATQLSGASESLQAELSPHQHDSSANR